jgi:hypothetical protein
MCSRLRRLTRNRHITVMHRWFVVAAALFAMLPAYRASLSDNESTDARSMKYLNSYKDLTVPAYLATFGSSQVFPSRFSLMEPPLDDDGHLCTFPRSIEASEIEETSGYLPSIGLFVRNGNCTAQQKAEITLKISRRYPSVRFLFIYSAVPPVEALTKQPTTLVPDYPVSVRYNNIAILYITYDDALKIIAEKEAYLKEINFTSSPYLMDSVSTFWSFDFEVSGLGNRDHNSGQRTTPLNGTEESPPNFFWFRFVLFGLLIVAPCFRAAYLWYAGGGRIHLRRNENGRVIGLQYIPPIPFWLAIGRMHQPTEPIRDTLTEEEFASLPEIKYQEPEADRHEMVSKEVNGLVVGIKATSEPNNDLEGEVSLNVSFASQAEKGALVEDESDSALTAPSDSLDDPTLHLPTVELSEVTPPIALSDVAHNAIPEIETSITLCTTCSICIDDFIPGETLTMLPRFVHRS